MGSGPGYPGSMRARILRLTIGAAAPLALSAAAVLPGASQPAPVGEAASASAPERTDAAVPRAGAGVERPEIEHDPIPYGAERKRQMANYSKRHYGQRSWRLPERHVRAVVLHYTAGSSYSGAWSTFASNAPALGERPGVCAQFVVDKDGAVYRLTSLKTRCRHTIGLNHRSIGIEMVQEDVGGPGATARAILRRKRQARAAVRLVAWLKQRYGIEMRDVIGHAMANDSRFFEDRTGWTNDHSDWLPPQVRKFRKRAKRLIRKEGPRFEPKRISFGASVEGRELTARALGNAASRRSVLVVGEVHGDESEGRRIVKRFRREQRRMKAARLWTVTTVNPDGHASGERKNARGVDLNRNFGVGWSGAEPPSSGYYGGPRRFSEPESRALRRLIKRADPDLTVYYHQPWGQVLAPCRGGARAEKLYAKRSGLPLERCRGEKLPGTATRWQERRGNDAFVVELPEGKLSKRAVRRHVGALAAVARR